MSSKSFSNLAPKGDWNLTGDATISGNLTVNGATTTIVSTTVTIDDKNIELGSVASPSDTTADGGGITLKGGSDYTILWENDIDAWQVNQHWCPSSTDGSQDLGTATYRWGNVYTMDLHLANERGDWTLVEEENYLTVRNNKNGKRYKLLMEELPEDED